LANSPERRFKEAIKSLRRQGIKWHTNVRQCCRGCVTAEQVGLANDEDGTTPYGWTFGGQGGAITWDRDGQPNQRFDDSRYFRGYGDRPTRTVRVYVNHGNGSAERIAQTFRDSGFEVEWDGSAHQCVVVTLFTGQEA
jgi:hypothetical protein